MKKTHLRAESPFWSAVDWRCRRGAGGSVKICADPKGRVVVALSHHLLIWLARQHPYSKRTIFSKHTTEISHSLLETVLEKSYFYCTILETMKMKPRTMELLPITKQLHLTNDKDLNDYYTHQCFIYHLNKIYLKFNDINTQKRNVSWSGWVTRSLNWVFSLIYLKIIWNAQSLTGSLGVVWPFCAFLE